jgi:hypothetical protein
MRELVERGNGRDDRNVRRARPRRDGKEEDAPGRGGDPRPLEALAGISESPLDCA